MALIDEINDGIKNAMRSKEKEKLEALRAIKAALLLEATKGGDSSISQTAEMQILTRLFKQRKESAAIYHQQGRTDLAAPEEFQAAIIESFLPKQLTEAEIQSEVEAIIVQVGAKGMNDMGKVMGAATAKLAGRAEGRAISEAVKKALAAL